MTYKPQYLVHINLNTERSQQWCADVLGFHTYAFMPGRGAFIWSAV